MELQYRKDIDGIRAIAVLSVLFFHAFPKIIPGGFIGVDVFFVISGFLISNLIIHQMTNSQFQWTTFYIKRINRLFPALIIVLLCGLVSGYFLLFSDEYRNLSKHIFGSAFFLNNFMLWNESGYFDSASEFKPLLHLWSLGIEEQFYLIWPLFLFLIWNRKVNPFISISSLVFVSFLINILGATSHGVATFYLPQSRFWELGLGGAIAYSCSKGRFQKSSSYYHTIFLNFLSILVLATLLLSVFYLSDRFIYPNWAALLPTLCTGVLLCTGGSWVNRNLLATPFLTLIGIISYPLYLWHWELLSFAHIIFSGALSNVLTSTLLVVSFGLAWITYYFIEKPIRFSIKGTRHASSIATMLGLFLLSIGGTAFIIYKHDGLESRYIAQTKKSFTEEIQNFDHYKTKVETCNITNQKQNDLFWCFKSRQGAPNKAIWGDSHADHLFPGLIKSAPKDNWLLLGQSSCPPLLGVRGFWIGMKDTCAKANKIALQTILENPSIDTVVLASLGPFYISGKGYAAEHLGEYAPSRYRLQSKKEGDTFTNKAKVFYEGLDLTISTLRKAGKKVILFQDVPELPFMPSYCFHRPLAPHNSCVISTQSVLKRQEVYKSLLVKLKNRYPDILIFNPIDFMCTKKDCQLTYRNHLIYRDSHHLSSAGSDLIGSKFVDWVKQQPEVG